MNAMTRPMPWRESLPLIHAIKEDAMSAIRTSLPAIALASMLMAGTAEASPSPSGLWLDHTGRGVVEITPCGSSLCGKIVWLKDARNGKACGMKILGGVRATGGGSWGGGWIYSPERKSRYDVELTPIGDDKLKVFGYAGVRMFGKTMTWTRAPEGLSRCDETIAATTSAPPATADTDDSAAARPKAADASAAPAAKSGEPKVSAATAKPVETAEAEMPEPAEPEAAETPKKNCKVRLPYVTLTFPCPE